MRVQKQNGSEETEYVYFGGQPIAERDATNGDWSDYIYAGGRRLARADSYAHRMRVYGTRCSNCGFQWYQFNIPNAGGLAGYTIRTGDRLIWLQWQNTNARGGLNMTFTDGSETYVVTLDQNGYDMNNSPLINQWDYRRVDLSQHAGKTVSQLRYSLSGDTLPGYWESYYDDVVLVSTDGKVQSVYNGQKAVSLGPFGSSGMTGTGYEVNRHPTHGQWPGTTTFFYHGDHLGSSRLQTGSSGYPLWEATYLPYGQEWVPPGGTFQPTANHYKFTGKERDAESGLDYFGARYYASAAGRFLSVDPSGRSIERTNPQTWNRYSYSMNSPLVFVDPNGKWSERVHNAIIDAVFGSKLRYWQLDILKRASARVDRDQSMEGAYKHGMRKPFQRREDAWSDGEILIRDNLNKAVEAQIAWERKPGTAGLYSTDALDFFGEALHTATDRVAPGHNHNERVWMGLAPAIGLTPGNTLGHIITDYSGSAENSIGMAEYAAERLWERFQRQLEEAREKERRRLEEEEKRKKKEKGEQL